MLVAIVVFFGVQLLSSGNSPNLVDIELGANYTPLVLRGEWDRLITASFMHSRELWLHIALNGLALWSLGRAIELLLGHGRFFVIYVIGCLGGGMASTIANPGAPSVGASTGIVGLFAAVGWVLFHFRRSLPPHMRRGARQWVVLLVLNIALWVAFSDLNIDHFGHGGGFVAGGLATIGLTWGWPPFERKKQRERVVNVLAFALLALVVASVAISLGRFARTREGDLTTVVLVARDALGRDEPSPLLLNDAAWTIAISPDATNGELELARRAAARGIEVFRELLPDEDTGALSDTLATTHYRLGELDDAVRVEREVYESTPDPTYGSQLARFLAARVARDGPLLLPRPGDAPEVSVRLDRGNGLAMVIESEGEAPNGFVLYAVVTLGERPLGLVRAAVPSGASPPLRRPIREPYPEGATLSLALVDGDPSPTPTGDVAISTVQMDSTVSAYP